MIGLDLGHYYDYITIWHNFAGGGEGEIGVKAKAITTSALTACRTPYGNLSKTRSLYLHLLDQLLGSFC